MHVSKFSSQDLPNISSLYMAGNGLTGTLPDLSGSSRLVNVSLSDNHLTGSIPLSMQQKADFAYFDLSNNKVRLGTRGIA